ncbi:Ail/Lom family outer membrane beta-barrel protein [Xenorhabdus sp. PB30.3]|uniref:Ail/Lom family outer membrane beta-barrel protein n=1 Tax=Xenorhabdus sp. PB30.3 TaxID=2788941 RepID=UPI001E53C05F|nr:Ail/Lom family outer membrane beta-barrel protein [Xenorhabdus sp. PB30.3]MCC8378779.1 outer membrane beta-barrel protein [Xenorhabdus sp. PB30.3]
MKKIILTSLVTLGLSAVSVGAYAAGESTISAGYAQNSIKLYGEKPKDNPKGFNVKYRYESDDNWGVVGSFVYTHQGYEYRDRGFKVGDSSVSYYSLTAGPSYRINDYVSVYGLVGAGHGEAEYSYLERTRWGLRSESGSGSKTELAYGAGFQVNPIPNIAIDASYEYTKLDDVKVGTWMVGVGYRF